MNIYVVRTIQFELIVCLGTSVLVSSTVDEETWIDWALVLRQIIAYHMFIICPSMINHIVMKLPHDMFILLNIHEHIIALS